MAGDVFDRSFCFLCIIIIVSCSLAKEKPVLFKEDGDVVILNVTNFKKTIHNSDYFWMVNFYNSWCGHCVNFAPVWNSFATSIKRWESVARIATIDCSVPENLQPCRDYNIDGYPTILTFPAHSPETFLGYMYNGSMTDAGLHHQLLEMLDHTSKIGGTYGLKMDQYSSLLRPLQSLEHIWQHVNTGVQYMAVLFEDENSYTGRELILDMYPYKELLLRRMLKKDVTEFGVKVFPSLYLIQKDGSFHNLASNGWDREHFRSALRQLLDLSPDVVARPVQRPSAQPLKGVKQSDSEESKTVSTTEFPEGVYMDDLLSAVSYSLMHEIAAIKVIDGQALLALKHYILVLAKYLPIPDDHKNFLWKVKNWLDRVQSPIEGSLWQGKLLDLQDFSSYIPVETNYTGCRGSEPRFRGYPCSMWVMFHTLTVNSVLERETDVTFDPQEVLLAVRGYITNFFGCRECSVNFNKGAKFIEEQIHQPDDAILFLWKSHNRANYRLHGDSTEDPEHPKIQFPSKKMCPKCYFDGPTKDDGKPNWDEGSVLNFLKKYYFPGNIHKNALHSVKHGGLPSQIDANAVLKGGGKISEIEHWRKNDLKRREDLGKLSDIKSEKFRSVYLYEGETKYDKKKIEQMKEVEFDTRSRVKIVARTDYFSGIDLSLCVVFYLMCTICILMVYYHFIVRRGMKPRICCKDLV